MKTRLNTTVERLFPTIPEITINVPLPYLSGAVFCHKESNVLSISIDLVIDISYSPNQNVVIGTLPEGFRPSLDTCVRVLKTDASHNIQNSYDLAITVDGKMTLLAFADSGEDAFIIKARIDIPL